MVTVIALVLQVLISLIVPTNDAVTVIPAKPNYLPTNHYAETAEVIEREWAEYNELARKEYEAIFTELYNSYTFKVAKNGRSMVNGKFVKMGNK